LKVVNTHIEGLVVIEPSVFGDERGYFYESFNKNKFIEAGFNFEFIQDNEAMSSKGVLRGLHFQLPPYSQTKLIRAISGQVLDVAVDLRKDSKTYGKHFSIVLSGENKKQVLVPKGFAHGYAVISDFATVAYKVDDIYMPSHERSILWKDETLNIDWMINDTHAILSEKDKNAIRFNEFETPF
jgi:dTDP-4-dehydrorhamnose 3,5-epimerase